MSGKFVQWVRHRQALLGFEGDDALAHAAGIDPGITRRIAHSSSLSGVGRSARGYLARTLEISVRELEDLASEKIQWIADGRRLDWSRWTPDSLRIQRGDSSEQTVRPVRAPRGQGVPLVGRILPGGAAHLLEECAWGDVPRLPVRFAGVPEAFALWAHEAAEEVPLPTAVVFRALPAGELRAGQHTLLSCSDGDGQVIYGQVERQMDGALRLRLSHSKSLLDISLTTVLRAARVIATLKTQGGVNDPGDAT